MSSVASLCLCSLRLPGQVAEAQNIFHPATRSLGAASMAVLSPSTILQQHLRPSRVASTQIRRERLTETAREPLRPSPCRISSLPSHIPPSDTRHSSPLRALFLYFGASTTDPEAEGLSYIRDFQEKKKKTRTNAASAHAPGCRALPAPP